MLGRKKEFDESVADYKLSLVRAKERKQRIQVDNGEYWKQQMDWKSTKKQQDYEDG